MKLKNENVTLHLTVLYILLLENKITQISYFVHTEAKYLWIWLLLSLFSHINSLLRNTKATRYHIINRAQNYISLNFNLEI